MWIRTLLLLLAIGGAICERCRYDGYKIFKVETSSKEQINMLAKMEAKGSFEILTMPGVNKEGFIMVPPVAAYEVPAELIARNIHVSLEDDKVQQKMDAQFKQLDARYENDPYNLDLDDFNKIEAIYAQYDRWVSACPSGLECKIINIGKTFENRDHLVFKVGKPGSGRKALWLESVLHAREWLACATELKMINHLITRYSSDPEVTSLVDKYDFYFLPVGNPDGYAYSWSNDRYWRKNRRDPFPGAWCTGSDLNRNFDAYFGTEGASPDICSMTYPGPGPNSEPETKNIVKFGTSLSQSQQIIAWMCVHTSGKMWMFPYGHTYGHQGVLCVRTDKHDQLMQVTNVAVNALESTFGGLGQWKKGTICETIYPATGDEISYAYDKLKVKYSFALELRGAGFVVDKSEIPKSFAEVWNGVVAMLSEIEKIEKY